MPAHALLRVAFNSTNLEGGPHNPTGFQTHQAGHEVAEDCSAARTYAAFGAANDASWQGDWIRIDTRTANGGNGDYDGTTGTSTRLLLRLGNLPAGTCMWRSYHHDTQDQNDNFLVQLSTNGGTTYTTVGAVELKP